MPHRIPSSRSTIIQKRAAIYWDHDINERPKQLKTFRYASIDFARIVHPIVVFPRQPRLFRPLDACFSSMDTIQAHYACNTGLRCRSSVFLAMTKFTKAQKTNR